jgi:hypothetical protein
VIKDLRPKGPFLAQIALRQSPGKRIAAISGALTIVSPAPPQLVQGPELFWTQTGSLYHVFPTPSPRAALPEGISNITKVPIIGRFFVSCTNLYLTPSSISSIPNARGPTPAGARLGLFDGKLPWPER